MAPTLSKLPSAFSDPYLACDFQKIRMSRYGRYTSTCSERATHRITYPDGQKFNRCLRHLPRQNTVKP